MNQLTEVFKSVRKASQQLLSLDDNRINSILNILADKLLAETPSILKANKEDLDRMDKEDPKYDRLMLTEERLKGIAGEMRNVATLPSPLGRILKEAVRPNGMRLRKICVPFGVMGIIYEARPNVTFDVFSLCFKSGSACILKGGTEASLMLWLFS